MFDLDETLVRVENQEPVNGYDGIFKVVDPEKADFYVSIRRVKIF